MEIINFGRQVTPKRVYTLVKLVEHLGEVSRKEILDFLQPESLVSNQEASKNAFTTAILLELIQDIENNHKKIKIHPSLENTKELDGMDNFRQIVQQRMLGITENNEDNYLFNLVTSWYAVIDDNPIRLSKSDLVNKFNSEVFPHVENINLEEGQKFNDVKLNAWLIWAAFLGFGYLYKDKLIPDARKRILPILNTMQGEQLPAKNFIERLSKSCPELDGGKLFNYCWQASRSVEQYGNQISLMLSTSLRMLQKLRIVNLIYMADAEESWYLHEATGYTNQLSHIKIEESNAY